MSTSSTIPYACEDVNELEIRSIPSTISLTSDLDDDDVPIGVQFEHHFADDEPPTSIVHEMRETSTEDMVLYTHHVTNPRPLAPLTVISETRIVPEAETNTQQIDLVYFFYFVKIEVYFFQSFCNK